VFSKTPSDASAHTHPKSNSRKPEANPFVMFVVGIPAWESENTSLSGLGEKRGLGWVK
jgi:hypothetical protein